MTVETLKYDDDLRKQYPIIAGCDEVGRGCLAGPVVTATVILPPNVDIEGVTDSKKINKKKHEELARTIFSTALNVTLGIRHANEIDKSNILEANKDAMRDAISNLRITPDLILIDGDSRQLLGTQYQEQTVVKGDATSLSIAAASIIAKYMRDRMMSDYDKQYPGYGFAKNAGYGTVQHREALEKYGITPIHRKTFEPIKSHIGVWSENTGKSEV